MAGRIEKSLLIVIAFAALALPQAGWAHGPSRQKITETIEIDAPPAKVWAAIVDFHDMSWLPGVAKTTGEGGNERMSPHVSSPLMAARRSTKASTNMTRVR
jgi:Polyketide cyclase / dehydrase and lipid transport